MESIYRSSNLYTFFYTVNLSLSGSKVKSKTKKGSETFSVKDFNERHDTQIFYSFYSLI